MQKLTESQRHIQILKAKKTQGIECHTNCVNGNMKAILSRCTVNNVVDHFCIPMIIGKGGIYNEGAKNFGDFTSLTGDDFLIEQQQMFIFWHVMFAVLNQYDLGTPDFTDGVCHLLRTQLAALNGVSGNGDDGSDATNNSNGANSNKKGDPFKSHKECLNREQSYIMSPHGSPFFSPAKACDLQEFYTKSGTAPYQPTVDDDTEKFSLYFEPLRKRDPETKQPTDDCVGFLLHVVRKDPNFSFVEALANFFEKSDQFTKANSGDSSRSRGGFGGKGKTPLSRQHQYLMAVIKDFHHFNPLLLKITLQEWYLMTKGFLECIEQIYQHLVGENANDSDSDVDDEDTSMHNDSSSSSSIIEDEEEDELWEDENDEGEDLQEDYVPDQEIKLSDDKAKHLSPSQVFQYANVRTFCQFHGACMDHKKKIQIEDGRITLMYAKLKNNQDRHPLDCFYNLPLKYFRRLSLHNSYFPWIHSNDVLEFYFRKDVVPLYKIISDRSFGSTKNSTYTKRLRSDRPQEDPKSIVDRLHPNKVRKTGSGDKSSEGDEFFYLNEDVSLPTVSVFGSINHVVLIGDYCKPMYEKVLTHKYATSAEQYACTGDPEDYRKMNVFNQSLQKFRLLVFKTLGTLFKSETPIVTDGAYKILQYHKTEVEGLKNFSTMGYIPLNLNSNLCWMGTHALWLYDVIKTDFDTFHNREHVMIIWYCTHDTYRQEKNLHLGTVTTGIHGGGKSRKQEIIYDYFLIEGSAVKRGTFSAKSLLDDMDKSDIINMMDEATKAFSGSSNQKRNDQMDDHNSGPDTTTIKELLSSKQLQHHVFTNQVIHLDDGTTCDARNSIDVITPNISTYFICSNVSFKSMNQALMDRMITLEISKKTGRVEEWTKLFPRNRTDRTIEYIKWLTPDDAESTKCLAKIFPDKKFDSSSSSQQQQQQQQQQQRKNKKEKSSSFTKGPQDSTETPLMMNRIQKLKRIFKVDQSLHMQVEKLIFCGGLPQPFMRGGYLMLSRFFDHMTKNGIPFNNRDFVKCMLMARVLVIKDAIHQVFKIYGCDRSIITYDNLIHVAPYLVCSFNHIVHAFTLLSCQFVNPFKVPTLNAIAVKFGIDTVLLHSMKELTSPEMMYDRTVYTKDWKDERQQHARDDDDDDVNQGEDMAVSVDEDDDAICVDDDDMGHVHDRILPNAIMSDGLSNAGQNIWLDFEKIWKLPIHYLHRLFLLDYINNNFCSSISWFESTKRTPDGPKTMIDLNYICVRSSGLMGLAAAILPLLKKGGEDLSLDSVMETLKEFTQTEILIDKPMPVCEMDQLIHADKIQNIFDYAAFSGSSSKKTYTSYIMEKVDDSELAINSNGTSSGGVGGIRSNMKNTAYKICLHALNEVEGGEILLNAIKSVCYKNLKPRTVVTGMDSPEENGLIRLNTEIYSNRNSAKHFVCASRRYIDDASFIRLYFNPMFSEEVEKFTTTEQSESTSQAKDYMLERGMDEIKGMINEEYKKKDIVIQEDIDEWAFKQHFCKNGIPFSICQETKEWRWRYINESGVTELRPLPTPLNQGERMRECMKQNHSLVEKLERNKDDLL